MVECYVLVHVEASRVEEAATEVRRVEGVRAVDVTTGAYDLVVRAHAASHAELMDRVVAAIVAVPPVIRAITCPVGTHERLWEEMLEPAYV
jgi:DNA-binding Lrp family transcriptional regulator